MNPSSYGVNTLRRFLSVASARLLFFFFRVPDRLVSKLKSSLLSAAYGWRNFFVHHSARILGADYMSLAPGFRSGRGLWMQSVYFYNHERYRPHLVIGSRFACSDYVHIACTSSVVIGDDVLVGSHVLITDHMHGSYSGSADQSHPMSLPMLRPLVGRSVEIGDRVLIGDSVRILPGSSIGSGCVIACNSVVNSILPANSVCGGTPARPIKIFSESSLVWERV